MAWDLRVWGAVAEWNGALLFHPLPLLINGVSSYVTVQDHWLRGWGYGCVVWSVSGLLQSSDGCWVWCDVARFISSRRGRGLATRLIGGE